MVGRVAWKNQFLSATEEKIVVAEVELFGVKLFKAATFPMHGYTSHFQVSGFKLGREGKITPASNPCRTVHPFLFPSHSV